MQAIFMIGILSTFAAFVNKAANKIDGTGLPKWLREPFRRIDAARDNAYAILRLEFLCGPSDAWQGLTFH